MKQITYLLLLFCAMLAMPKLLAQEHFPKNGVADPKSGAYAFTNATIYIDADTKLENATLLIKKGKVVQAGTNVSVPAGYVTIDATGKHIYPSLIDAYTNYGLPKVEDSGFSWGRREQIEPETEGAYNANDAINTDINAAEVFKNNEKEAEAWRKMGFGSVLSFHPDGLARGTSVFATLGDQKENASILKAEATAHYAFDKGSSKQDYPTSIMGYVAVLRQTHFDAEWYKGAKKNGFFDITLESYNKQQPLPQIFEASDWQAILRAYHMGKELGKKYIYRTGGDEYQRLAEIKATGSTLIVPINFPEGYKIADPLDAMDVELAKLKHWEMAPANLAMLEKEGVTFAITADGLKKKKDFWSNLRKAVEYGLSEKAALKALTSTPAKIAGVNDKVGDLKSGKLANFIITDGNLFEKGTKVMQNWVQGKPFRIQNDEVEADGKYKLSMGDQSYTLEIAEGKFKVFTNDTTSVKGKGSIGTDGMMTLSFTPNKETGVIRLSGWFNNAAEASKFAFNGKGQLPNGDMVDWTATYESGIEEKDKESKEDEAPELGSIIYPFTAYGQPEVQQAQSFLIKNATIWTNEADGIVESADIMVEDGKISKVGKGLKAKKGMMEIDGTGKHVTSGVIDEHSHIALRSVNDVAVSSAMVRMSDVVNSEDIDIYRQLSGGVTAAQLLHGSANPVGGQSALIKLRWGKTPQEMLIKNSDGYIKFALGENVKRSRSSNSIRFPQTRMGVEQVYVDAFTQAKEYDAAWKKYNSLSSSQKANTAAPRRDLMLETMAEILNKERFVTCHSYVQSEINMLMKVAEQFNFTVNTFTHILEGYKVADKMAKHGVGGSTFSDWWAYKYEVKDAIPYNPKLMHDQGVVVAINSDDAEMGRRLNQEAAKSVKYGGMSQEDAWKMVTLNPAKLLHLDNRMGSLKAGKDADIVIWSANPLSIYAKAEKTFVDGVKYFDIEKDVTLKEEVKKERARLIQKMQGEGGGKSPYSTGKRHRFHCDDMFEVGIH